MVSGTLITAKSIYPTQLVVSGDAIQIHMFSAYRLGTLWNEVNNHLCLLKQYIETQQRNPQVTATANGVQQSYLKCFDTLMNSLPNHQEIRRFFTPTAAALKLMH